jgi:ABC-2 type transport system permease protein
MNRFGSGVTLPAFVADPRLLPLFALFATLGFFMWFTLYAAIAATVDDPNTSSRSMLLFAPFLPLGLGFAALARDADAWATRLLGMLPITSPAVMPLRACLAPVPAWEVVLAAGLLVATAWLLRRLAGRVFAVGILMYGKEPTWSEVRRWSKEARRR